MRGLLYVICMIVKSLVSAGSTVVGSPGFANCSLALQIAQPSEELIVESQWATCDTKSEKAIKTNSDVRWRKDRCNIGFFWYLFMEKGVFIA